MPLDDRRNPLSTASEQQVALLEKRIDDLKAEYIQFFNGETRQPPEKKREDLEKAVHRLIVGGSKTAKMEMIIQNLAQRFTLYNNLWLKKLNELETGTPQARKKGPAPEPAASKQPRGPREVFLTLNDEETFERFASVYNEMLPGSAASEKEREKVIESIKAKMLTHNLIEARISFSRQGNKLSIRIKK